MNPILIFDYDGTLQETLSIYEPAVRRIRELLIAQGYLPPNPGRERIESWLGMRTDEMWKDFMPELPAEQAAYYGKKIGAEMLHAIEAGHAAWYPCIVHQLEALKQCGFRMLVLSNCGNAYAEAVWKRFHMERYFTEFIPCERYGNLSKADVLELIIGERKFGLPIMIGDRANDLEAARRIDCPMIGCGYGYGTAAELQGCDCYIRTPEELTSAVLGRLSELQNRSKLRKV